MNDKELKKLKFNQAKKLELTDYYRWCLLNQELMEAMLEGFAIKSKIKTKRRK